MIKTALNIRSLCIGYDRKALPLEPLNVSLESGQILCCTGENGRGKSTFFRTLCGLMPAISGEILVHGKSLWSMTMDERSRWIAIASTERIRLDGLTVAEVFALNPWFADHASPIPLDLVKRELLMAEIEHLPLSSLSDGQYKRVMIARCLLQQTPILLLDEPFAHLDQELEKRVQTMISTCARDYHRTILFTAHREVSFHEETQMLEL
ncbi:MAG: ATP-binding cassette domain-containing protein [Flavobacteriales bacterium]